MRVPLLLEEISENRWRYRLPSFNLAGEADSRLEAHHQAMRAIEHLAASWDIAEGKGREITFLHLSIGPEEPAVLDWQTC